MSCRLASFWSRTKGEKDYGKSSPFSCRWHHAANEKVPPLQRWLDTKERFVHKRAMEELLQFKIEKVIESRIMERNNNAIWEEYLGRLESVMQRFQSDKTYDMLSAYNDLDDFPDGSSIPYEIIEFSQNTISEIGSCPALYLELLDMARRRVSQDEFIDYMNF